MRPRVRDRTLRLREVARHGDRRRGQTHFIGTPEQLAAHVIAWQDAGAVDGFTHHGIDTAATS